MTAMSSFLPVGAPVDAHPAPRPQRSTVLAGRHVDIVAFDPKLHARDLYELSHGDDRERLWAYLGAAPYPDFATFLAAYEAAAGREDPLMFAIRDRATGRAVGHATYMRIDTANRVIEIGNILYTPALMRTQGGTEAMYLMARHVFETLGYRRYEWKCNALNAPSRRAAERYGFTFEGIFRHHMIVKGHNRDTAWFSMLEEEWPQRAVAMEAWLAPENFDADGRQHVSLSVLNAGTLDTPTHSLRRASLGDRPAVEALQRAAFARNRELLGTEPIPLQWEYGQVFRTREVWVLDGPEAGGTSGALAGVLILQPRADDLYIDNIGVAPGAQGRGLGNVLLDAAEMRARALGRRQMRLITGEKLVDNVHWYRRKGFGIEQVRELADRRVVHMLKPLG
ncbi:GNAT family N-acetyltransferase [Ancylobacter sp. G4_0304]|uniref:GNAT family N-acetyltransferase n=1 Tax=Ancylobacter sp. G4_0304 TaxID=3114289 RepID=UPI0039C6F88F